MADETKSRVVPGLRYRDAPAAIEWLCRAFGFERHLVVPGEEGTIAHAQLTLGGGMIMLGTGRDDEYGRLIGHPQDLGGLVTDGVCLIVEDADAVHARAVEAGAEILLDIEDQHYGGRAFTCRDPEGYVWNVGSYDPWTD